VLERGEGKLAHYVTSAPLREVIMVVLYVLGSGTLGWLSFALLESRFLTLKRFFPRAKHPAGAIEAVPSSAR
jgi:hypothetical protein